MRRKKEQKHSIVDILFLGGVATSLPVFLGYIWSYLFTRKLLCLGFCDNQSTLPEEARNVIAAFIFVVFPIVTLFLGIVGLKAARDQKGKVFFPSVIIVLGILFLTTTLYWLFFRRY